MYNLLLFEVFVQFNIFDELGIADRVSSEYLITVTLSEVVPSNRVRNSETALLKLLQFINLRRILSLFIADPVQFCANLAF